jgi:hypothetical protein
MNLSALFPPWLAHIPIDWIAILIFTLLLTFDAMRSGSGRASVLAVTFPVAAFLSNLLPHTFVIGAFATSLSSSIVQAAIFLLVFVAVFIFMYRIIINLAAISRGLFFSFLAAISATIVIIVMWLQVPALVALWHFSGPVQSIFGASYAFFWLLGAYLILAFVRS